MGMVGRMARRWGEANRQYLAGNQRASDVGGGLGAVSKVLRMMLQSARARGRRLSGDPSGGDRRHHHRRLDPERARAGAGRSRHRALEGFRRRAAELAPADQAAGGICRRKRRRWRCRRRRSGWRSRTSASSPPGVQKVVVQDVNFKLEAGKGLGIIGPSGSGKSSLARAAGRRLAAGARQGAARRRRARSMVAGRARPPHRLSAAGCRIAGRHGGAEHLPLRIRAANPRRSSPRPRRPASTT